MSKRSSEYKTHFQHSSQLPKVAVVNSCLIKGQQLEKNIVSKVKMASTSHQGPLEPVPVSSLEAKKLSCPVCFTFLCFPIYQCENGHLICSKCIPQFRKCPVCRVALPETKIRNLIAEDNAAKLPFRCRNWKKGCNVIVKKNEESEHVEKNCEYHSIRVCPYLGFPGCFQDLLVKDIVNHLKTVHHVPNFIIQDGQYVEMAAQCGIPGEEDPLVILLSESYPPLALDTWVSKRNVYFTIFSVHSHEKVKNLKAKIKIFTDTEEINSITWKGPLFNPTKKDLYADSLRECLSVPIRRIKGLKYWKLLVKVSSEANKKTGAQLFPQPSTQARVQPNLTRRVGSVVQDSTDLRLADDTPHVQVVTISSTSDSE